MINRFFSKLGKGTKVNLVLDKASSRSGETVTGQIVITGGNSDQQIDKLQVHLLFYAKVGAHQANAIVQTIDLTTAQTLPAKGELRLPFSYQLPELPQSSQYVRYRFRTVAEIQGTTSQHDTGDFSVLPSESIRAAQNGWRALGFKDLPRSGRFTGVLQTFEFEAIKGAFKNRISDPEVVFLPETDGVRLHLAFRTPTFDYWQYASLHLPADVLQSAEQTQQLVRDLFEQELQKPLPNNVPTLPAFEKQDDEVNLNNRLNSEPKSEAALLSNTAISTHTAGYTFSGLSGAEIPSSFVFDSIPFDSTGYGSRLGDPSVFTASGGSGHQSSSIDSGGLNTGGHDGGASSNNTF